jgi:hypothetical protein
VQRSRNSAGGRVRRPVGQPSRGQFAYGRKVVRPRRAALRRALPRLMGDTKASAANRSSKGICVECEHDLGAVAASAPLPLYALRVRPEEDKAVQERTNRTAQAHRPVRAQERRVASVADRGSLRCGTTECCPVGAREAARRAPASRRTRDQASIRCSSDHVGGSKPGCSPPRGDRAF